MMNTLETRTNLCRRIPDDLWRYSALKEVERNSAPLQRGLRIVWLFKVNGVERGERSIFRVQKPLKHSLCQIININVSSGSSSWWYEPLIGCYEKQPFASGMFLPKHCSPNLWESYQINLNWWTLYRIPDQSSQLLRPPEKGKSDKPSRPMGVLGDMMSRC